MNLGAQFRRLLPNYPLLIGEVVSSSGGTTVVELKDGTEISVRGSAAVGQSVFVRAGAIEGVAPPLGTVSVIEV